MTYRYAGDDMVDDLPEYTITELPEGYAEDRDQRIEFGTQTYISYQNGDINSTITLATVYKGNIIKNLIMDCQSYTKYRPNETTGGIFVSWRRKEELPTGA